MRGRRTQTETLPRFDCPAHQPVPVPRESPSPTRDTWKDTRDFAHYSEADYAWDVQKFGLRATWEAICAFVRENGEQRAGVLRIADFGDLYERGLALRDKTDKKRSGQYYTPPDVARVMAEWLDRAPGEQVCDVACGTGNLTLAYLDFIGDERARALLRAGKVWLYDSDELALRIGATAIALRYGEACAAGVRVCAGDFLSRATHLPPNAKVIANPPYAAIANLAPEWEHTEVVLRGRELYAAFLEKIWAQSVGSVVITPYSFIGGAKFLPLRRAMNERAGFVVSFDNIPGTIFVGRKHGVFNTNKGNSVRAAITVAHAATDTESGFRLSPLIRFRREERARLLTCATLEAFLGRERQRIDAAHPVFAKCDRRLEPIYRRWLQTSTAPLGRYVSAMGAFELFVPNTCRYFTVASRTRLERRGQIALRFGDEDLYWYVFGTINGSFAYWHWRLFDGGITYPSGLLAKLPLFPEALSADDKAFFKAIGQEMAARAEAFTVTKNNVGAQQNLKYPRRYRDALNRRLLDILGLHATPETCFDIVHSNAALRTSRGIRCAKPRGNRRTLRAHYAADLG